MNYRMFDAVTKQELFQTISNAICPVQYVDEAKEIVGKFMETIMAASQEECAKTNFFLPIFLSYDGNLPATHQVCNMRSDTKLDELMVDYIRSSGKAWCDDSLRTTDDEITLKFCIVQGSLHELLKKTGLKIAHKTPGIKEIL